MQGVSPGLAAANGTPPAALPRPSSVGTEHKPWHAQLPEQERRNLISHIYRLFSQRQRNGSPNEWTDKLPDFVKRLEEALYRAADSKEDYSNLATLENRLQEVARGMVSQQETRRSWQGRPQMPQSFSAQSSYPGQPLQQAQQQQQQQGQPGYPEHSHRGQLSADHLQAARQQQQQQPGQAEPAAAGAAAMPSLLGSLGQVHALPGHSQAGGVKQDSPQLAASQHLASPGPVKADSSQSGLPQAGASGQAMPPQLNSPLVGQGNQPTMSNGKPVLLRGGKDWLAAHSPAIPNGMPQPQGMQQQQSGRLPYASSGLLPGQQPGANMLGASVPMHSMAGRQGPQMQAAHALRGQAMQQAQGYANGMIPNPSAASPGISGMVPVGMNAPQNSMPGVRSSSHLQLGTATPFPSQGGMQGQSYLNNHGSMQDGSLGMNMAGVGGMPNMPTSSGRPNGFSASEHSDHVHKQQRWLLFLRHCAKCNRPDNQCQYGQSCMVAKQLWRHILTCSDPACSYPRCMVSRDLLKHHQRCVDASCEVCTPVKNYVARQRQAQELEKRQREEQLQQQQLQYQRQQQQQQQHQQQQYEHAQHHHLPNQGQNGVPKHVLGKRGIADLENGHVQPQQAQQQPQQYAVKRFRTVVDPNNCGTSLVEAFGALQIRQHIQRLRQPDVYDQGPGSRGQPMGGVPAGPPNPDDDSACAVCGIIRLTFEPPAVYCTSCAQRIKRNQVYYTTPASRKSEVKGYWCHACYSDHRSDNIEVSDVGRLRKSELEKKKNDEESEEGWVQCDQCERWVHQICGLFNKGRNTQDTHYMCPMCLQKGLESGTRQPIDVRPQSMLEGRDLPTCDLTKYLQQQLDDTLDTDAAARAAACGRDVSQVERVEGLTVRVVSNVKKRAEVKPRFLDAFQQAENFPTDLPYTQKVILLFQCIDGVDTCLYALYMQEYGDDCPAPNRKWIYLSYLDSIKYMRPDNVESARPGIALRTLVYHQIIISYLAYVKARGFTSMFIWACPPLQGDDYILYCHPQRQKTPRSDRLREWYLTLLRTARDQGVVAHLGNLFDTFFEGGRGHRDRVSASLLPHFDGDYWPGEAENALAEIQEQQRKEGKNSKKGPRGKAIKGKRYGQEPSSADAALMARLGDVINSMREDFIVVHLSEPCSYCRCYISGSNRYYHPAPPSRVTIKQERTFEGISLDQPGCSSKQVTTLSRFQLCEGCYANEQAGPAGGKAKGLPAGIMLDQLVAEPLPPIPVTHDEGNPIMTSEFFDTRQAFLSLCQGNHYQFDTLRRAKHSSMMVLYHLHNPEAPAFASSCNCCHQEVEPGAGLRCRQCPDFDLCISCHERGVHGHDPSHQLVAPSRGMDETRMRFTDAQRQERAAQLQRTMALLVHASQCRGSCPSTNCARVKQLFKHAMNCDKRPQGNCGHCRRVWSMLQLHARGCQQPECPVPRCRELRGMRRRQIQRQEDARRTNYMQMMVRQQGPGTSSRSSSTSLAGHDSPHPPARAL